MAALVGGTLLNLAARAISAQAVLPAESRKVVTLVIDEFQTLPGADYEQILGELAKYGANVLLACAEVSAAGGSRTHGFLRMCSVRQPP